jgi:hypothetical protein
MSIIRKLAPIAGASILLIGLASGASAYQCKKLNVTGVFASTGQASTLAGARAQWTAKAKSAYGLSWSVWNIAAGKRETCTASGNGYSCVVKAKPCNYVVQ